MKVFPRMSGAAVALVLMASPALAQDPYLPPAPDENWKYSAAFYVWMSSMDGELRTRGLEADVDADYNEFLDDIESTFGLRFEAWQRDSVGFTFDTNWLTLKDDPDFISGTGEVEIAFGFTEATVAARTRSGNAYLDVYGGVRWLRVESELTDPSGTAEDHSKNYFDPLVGLRVGFLGTAWLHASVRFDIGGFNVGTERTGHLAMAVDFLVSPTVALTVGWRSMAIEIDEEERQKADLLLTGPVLAVRVGF